MPHEIEQNHDKHLSSVDSDRYVFQSREEMCKSMNRLCYGNLYIIGRIWIEGLKYALTGSKMSLVPTVHAAPPPPPQKPPKMKLKDLPFYDSPHVKYEYHQDDVNRKECPDINDKILQHYIISTISNYRKRNQEMICELKKFMTEMYSAVLADFDKNKADFKRYMRSDDNVVVRNVFFVMGPLSGYCFARRNRLNDISRLTFAALGGCFSGWICYPKQTDQVVRNLSYMAVTGLLAFVTLWLGCDSGLKDDAICKENLPPIPPQRKEDPKYKCPPAKPKSSREVKSTC